MKKIIFLFGLLITTLFSSSQTTTSVQDGNWNNATTWDNGVPTNNGTAIINHSVTLDIDATISDITINDTLSNNSNRLRVKNNFTNNNYYDETGSGYTQFRNGGGDKNIYGVTYFNRLVLNTNDSVFTNDTIYIKNRLNLNNGVLDVTNGILILKNDSINTGRMGRSVNGEIVGDFIWQKWIDRCNEWSIYSEPFGVSLNDISSEAPGQMIYTGFPGSDYPAFSWVNTYVYSEPSGWLIPTNANDVLPRGDGYWYWNSDTVYGSSGPPIVQEWLIETKGSMDLNTSFDFGVLYTVDGWNLLGNPYPGTINWDKAGWTKTNVNNAIYTWTTCGQLYSSYVGGIGTNGGNKYIPSGQGFWIEANNTSPSLICTQNVLDNTDEQLKAGEIKKVMFVELDNDEIAISMDSLATYNFDGNFDAYKYDSDNANIYSYIGSENYSINTLEDTSYSLSLRVRGEGTLNFSGISTFDEYIVTLEDTVLNTITLLSDTSTYTFTSDIDSTIYTDRFIVHFNKYIFAGDVENDLSTFNVYPNPVNDNLFINDINNEINTVRIIDVLGNVLYNDYLNNSNTIDVSNLPTGVYILEFNGDNKIYSKKIIKN